MENKYYHLQNLIFEGNEKLEVFWEMFYRKTQPVLNYEDKSIVIGAGQVVDFTTYFNGISMKKWKKYTYADQLILNLEAEGKFEILLVGYEKEGVQFNRRLLKRQTFNLKEKEQLVLEYPKNNYLTAGFEIRTLSSTIIYKGSYGTYVEEKDIQPVSLHLATTTFKKEDFILPNLELLKKEILEKQDDMAEHFWVHVIDNGRSLNVEEVETEHIQVHPNMNTGGAGGFTRGMLESMDHKEPATHILLMDDDVTILPESIRRTYQLLKIQRPEYKDYFISGAMLHYEEMYRLYEDIGFLRDNGEYGPVKYPEDLRKIECMMKADEIVHEPRNSYAGWWYCCIPTTVANKENLPLPLFIRCDDVEYSIRNKAKFITMNGICIWHMGFTNKFNGAMEFYQVHRNSLITQAISGMGENIDFIKRINRQVRIELLRFNYKGANLLLDAIEDYMKGYKFIKKNMGETLMKEKGAMNEQLEPLSNFQGAPVKVWTVYDDDNRGFLETFLFRITYNGHLVPSFMLKKEPGYAAYDWFYSPHKYFFRKKLLVINPYFRTGAYRTLDKKEFFKVILRRKKLNNKYNRIHERLEQDYRSHKAELTSEKFWRNYLELDKKTKA